MRSHLSGPGRSVLSLLLSRLRTEQPGYQLFTWYCPTLAGEAADVEVIALDTNHLTLAGVPTAVALDDSGAAPRGVGVLLIGNCWQKRERKAREGKGLLTFVTQPGIVALTSAGQLQKNPPATLTEQPDIWPLLRAKGSQDLSLIHI